jgi:hypothetical protein
LEQWTPSTANRHPTRGEHHQRGVSRVIGKALPGGDLPIGYLERAFGENRPDDRFGRAAVEAAAVRPGDRELGTYELRVLKHPRNHP